MKNTEKLSNDINFVKEFEALKLKQSLLIESLKNKKKEEKIDQYVKEIHMKITQLLDVFLEAKKQEEEKNESKDEAESKEKASEEKHSQVIDEISKMNKKIMDMDEILKRLDRNLKTALNSGIKPDSNTSSNGESNLPPIPKSWDKK